MSLSEYGRKFCVKFRKKVQKQSDLPSGKSVLELSN